MMAENWKKKKKAPVNIYCNCRGAQMYGLVVALMIMVIQKTSENYAFQIFQIKQQSDQMQIKFTWYKRMRNVKDEHLFLMVVTSTFNF